MKAIQLFLTTLVVILISSISYGQSDNNNESPDKSITDFIRDYQPPNYSYTRLSLSPSFGESSNNTNLLSKSQFNLNLTSFLDFRQQRDKSNTTVRGFLDERFQKGQTDDIQTGGTNFIKHSLQLVGQHDYYFKEKLFLGIGVETYGNAVRSLIDDWDFDQSNNSSIVLGVGFGRPFTVNRAWMANSIFNDLECNGIAVDRSHVQGFADLLAMQQNRRIFDNRLDGIKRQTEVFNFLQENEVAEFTPFSAAVIGDSYGFENFRDRQSGYRLYGGVKPGVDFDVFRTEDNESKTTEYSIVPFIQFDYFLPISEDWQFDASTFFSAKSLLNEDVFNRSQARAQLSLAWLPNFRIRSSLNLLYAGNFSEVYNFNGVNLGYSLDYYFSPRLVANFDAVVGKNWSGIPNEIQESFSQRITFGINYFLL